ncbi:MAG TPA: hypothetical protein VJ960_07710, partial [Oceanipulchritudo sp.]|nr:hypothetical protein [Oceanipulchritudo sp.]
MKTGRPLFFSLLIAGLLLTAGSGLSAQGTAAPGIDFQLSLGDGAEGADVGVAIQLVVLMTL